MATKAPARVPARNLSQEVNAELREAARKHNLPINLLEAIAIVESGGRTQAVNVRTKDYGLMQINRRNFAHLNINVKKSLQLGHNVRAASVLLTELKAKFGHEKHWYVRYNCGWKRGCPQWRVAKAYRVKLAAAGYGRGSNYE